MMLIQGMTRWIEPYLFFQFVLRKEKQLINSAINEPVKQIKLTGIGEQQKNKKGAKLVTILSKKSKVIHCP